MNLLEKLDALKRKTGDSNASLARKSGIPVTTIYGLYQKGYANMQLSTLEALCSYFNVSLDYLAKDDMEKDPATSGELEKDETELLDIYRGLNDTGKSNLIRQARYLDSDPDMKKDGASNTATA